MRLMTTQTPDALSPDRYQEVDIALDSALMDMLVGPPPPAEKDDEQSGSNSTQLPADWLDTILGDFPPIEIVDMNWQVK